MHIISFIILIMLVEISSGKDFSILTHGAVPNDTGYDTAAIQAAIQACHEAGGGRVVVSKGKFLIETLRLADKVELHLEEGAVLCGSPDEAIYGGFITDDGNRHRRARWNRGLIIGESLRDISITGPGLIDGNKVRDAKGEEGMRGPHTILLKNCENVVIRDVSIHNSGNYALLFYSCRNLTTEKVTFTGGWDGVHFRGGPDSWNQNITIRNCRFETGDDSIAGHHIEDSVVENCTINSSCNGIRLIGPARRWTIRDCGFQGPGKFPHITQSRQNMLAGILLQPGAWGRTPGPVEDITITDIEMNDVACAFQIVAGGPENPTARISISELKATDIYESASSVEAWNDVTIQDVRLESIHLSHTDGVIDNVTKNVSQSKHTARPSPAWGLYLRSVKDIKIEKFQLDVVVKGNAPAILAEKVESLSLKDIHYPATVEHSTPFFKQIN